LLQKGHRRVSPFFIPVDDLLLQRRDRGRSVISVSWPLLRPGLQQPCPPVIPSHISNCRPPPNPICLHAPPPPAVGQHGWAALPVGTHPMDRWPLGNMAPTSPPPFNNNRSPAVTAVRQRWMWDT
jgi:hypothetical protein